MKNKILMLTYLMLISLSLFAINVPKKITDAFLKKFPGATSVKWEKENAREYEANFKINGKAMSANFLTNGSWTETEAIIDIAELPAAVVSTVTLKYPGYIATGAYKIEKTNGKITYETEIKKGSKKKEVILTAEGMIVK